MQATSGIQARHRMWFTVMDLISAIYFQTKIKWHNSNCYVTQLKHLEKKTFKFQQQLWHDQYNKGVEIINAFNGILPFLTCGSPHYFLIIIETNSLYMCFAIHALKKLYFWLNLLPISMIHCFTFNGLHKYSIIKLYSYYNEYIILWGYEL